MTTEECIRVVVRCRPLNDKEKNRGDYSVVEMNEKLAQMTLVAPQGSKDQSNRTRTFDATYGPDTQQKDIFNISFLPMVRQIYEGYNATIFAYGQSGSGKSFTMMGGSGDSTGAIPRSVTDIFQYVSEHKSETTRYMIKVSYLEIYNEKLIDLLHNPKAGAAPNLEIREFVKEGVNDVEIRSLTMIDVNTLEEVLLQMETGDKRRQVAATGLNATSSRSHAIFQLRFEEKVTVDKVEKFRMGTLNMVDLAGSERVDKTGATGDLLTEGNSINLSLSCLKQVIMALATGGHPPYRNSKLTRVLSASLGGNAKTLLCANMNPSNNNYEESKSTLIFADDCKKIKNKAIINEDPKDSMIRQLDEKIKALEQELAAYGDAANGESSGPAAPSAPVDEKTLAEQQRLDEELAALREKQAKMAAPDPNLLSEKSRVEAELREAEAQKAAEFAAELELKKQIKAAEAQAQSFKSIQDQNKALRAQIAEADAEVQRLEMDALGLRRQQLEAELLVSNEISLINQQLSLHEQIEAERAPRHLIKKYESLASYDYAQNEYVSVFDALPQRREELLEDARLCSWTGEDVEIVTVEELQQIPDKIQVPPLFRDKFRPKLQPCVDVAELPIVRAKVRAEMEIDRYPTIWYE